MKGVKYEKFENGIQSLSVVDVGQVPVWRGMLKVARKMLKKEKDPQKKKEIEEDIIVLDMYIFLSGSDYSIMNKTPTK